VCAERRGEQNSAWPYSSALFREHGDEVVARRAAAGDREAQWSLGFRLVCADGVAGTPLGAAGRSPKSDVGSLLRTVRGVSGVH
jgi:hypothetical protein